MLPNEDGRRMIEFNHDDAAGTDVSKISPTPVIQAAIAHTHATYQAAGHALVQASAVVVRETGETRQARHKLEGAGVQAKGAWQYLVTDLTSKVLNPPPEAVPAADVMAARHALMGRLFSITARDFERAPADRKLEVLRFTLLLAAEPASRDVLGDHVDAIQQRLGAARTELAARQTDLHRELREDRAAYEHLEKCRGAFDLAQAAHFRQVQSALIAQGREGEAGRYIRSQDAAYRARRDARRPIKEEEGIEAVTTALGVTTDAIEPPLG